MSWTAQATHEKMFDPPLPEQKAEAIMRMGFGVINKVYIVSDAPDNQARYNPAEGKSPAGEMLACVATSIAALGVPDLLCGSGQAHA